MFDRVGKSMGNHVRLNLSEGGGLKHRNFTVCVREGCTEAFYVHVRLYNELRTISALCLLQVTAGES